MTELVSAIVYDVFKTGMSEALGRLLNGRREVAKNILISELERGNAFIQDVADVDEVAAMVFEYTIAAQRGSARLNLRLMAQVLAGQVQRSPLYADKFLRWSAILASLSREEVIVASALYQEKLHRSARGRGLIPSDSEQYFASRDLVGVGKTFNSAEAFVRTASALTRTGLVISMYVEHVHAFQATDLMEEIVNLIDIEAAMAEPLR